MLERSLLRAAIIALGMTLAGLLIGLGFTRGRTADRFVSVKGVSAREVRADVAIWPLHVVGADNDLTTAHVKLTRSIAGVKACLVRHGVDTTAVELTGFGVFDAQAQQYGGDRVPANRFVVRQTLLVRSTKPEQVLDASQKI